MSGSPFGTHLGSVQWVLENIPPLVKKLELEAVSSLASKNKWSYMHKSQVPGHLGDFILHGGDYYLWGISIEQALCHLYGVLEF